LRGGKPVQAGSPLRFMAAEISTLRINYTRRRRILRSLRPSRPSAHLVLPSIFIAASGSAA